MKHKDYQDFKIFQITFGSHTITFEDKFGELFIKFSLIENNQLCFLPSQSNAFRLLSTSEKPEYFTLTRLGSDRTLNTQLNTLSIFINDIEFIIEIEFNTLLLTSQSDKVSIFPNSGNSFYVDIS